MKSRYLALSLFLHALLLLAWLGGPLPRLSDRLPHAPLPVEVVKMRIAGTGGEGKPRPRAAAPSLGLKDLGVNFGLDVKKGASPRGLEKGDDFAAETPGVGVYQYLYRKIDENTVYPDEFKAARIEGEVTAQLTFAPDGRYLEYLSRVDSSSRYLRLNVLRTIRRAFLDHRLPGTMRIFDRNFALDCRFLFKITQNDDERLKASVKLLNGTKMLFYRSWYHSKLQWELGPLAGMLPIPAVGINPAKAVQMISDLFSNKAKISPLQSWQEDPDF